MHVESSSSHEQFQVLLLKISSRKPVFFFYAETKTQKPFMLRKTNKTIGKSMINKGNKEKEKERKRKGGIQ
jgi:hypothetical protein